MGNWEGRALLAQEISQERSNPDLLHGYLLLKLRSLSVFLLFRFLIERCLHAAILAEDFARR